MIDENEPPPAQEVPEPEAQTETAVVEPPPPPPPAPPAPPAPPQFNALHGGCAFGLLMAAQMISAIVVVVGYVVYAIANGVDPTRVVARLETEGTVALLASAAIGSALVMLLAMRIWTRGRREEFGLVAVPARALAPWAAIGAIASAIYLAIVFAMPPAPGTTGGPLSAAADAGGWSRFMVALLAIAVAPPVEEFFFRGLMFRGFSQSWGVRTGGTVVTVLFVVLHLFEAWNYWPAIIAIATLAVTALEARIRTGSVIPAMVLHAAYNGVIVIGVYVFD